MPAVSLLLLLKHCHFMRYMRLMHFHHRELSLFEDKARVHTNAMPHIFPSILALSLSQNILLLEVKTPLIYGQARFPAVHSVMQPHISHLIALKMYTPSTPHNLDLHTLKPLTQTYYWGSACGYPRL